MRVVISTLALLVLAGAVAFATLPGSRRDEEATDGQSSPEDCAAEMPSYAPLQHSNTETGVRGQIMQDARARTATSCAVTELGCLYQLTRTDLGWWVSVAPHPFLPPD